MTNDSLLDALRRSLPTDLPSPLQLYDEGFGGTIFQAGDTIVRVPKSADAMKRLALVNANLPTIQRFLPVRVPVPLWDIPPTADLPLGAFAYRHIPGQPLGPDSGRSVLAEQVGQVLAAIHRIDPETLPGPLPDRAVVAAERERVMGTVLPWLADIEPPSVIARLESWWRQFKHTMNQADLEPCLVHGDFWFGNLLTDQSGESLVAVLDWEQAALDDPAQDLATLLHSSPRFAATALEAYRSAGGHADHAVLARRNLLWQYREFTGLAMAIEMDDEPERDEAMQKLRLGGLRHFFDLPS
jgi:aminoglycoside phosphotransferase (APT) family kinase protein